MSELSTNESTYLRQLAADDAGRIFYLNHETVLIRRQLDHQQRHVKLIAEMFAATRAQGVDYHAAVIGAAQRINSALNMQRTAIFTVGADGKLTPLVIHGYPDDESIKLHTGHGIAAPAELLGEKVTVVTGADEPTLLAAFRAEIYLPYFIAVPLAILNGSRKFWTNFSPTRRVLR